MVEVGAGFTFRRDTKPENFMALGGDETDNINIGNRRQESFEEIGFIRSEIDPIQKGSVTPIATTGRNFLDRSVFENEPGGNFGSLGAVSGLSPLLVAGEQAAAPPPRTSAVDAAAACRSCAAASDSVTSLWMASKSTWVSRPVTNMGASGGRFMIAPL